MTIRSFPTILNFVWSKGGEIRAHIDVFSCVQAKFDFQVNSVVFSNTHFRTYISMRQNGHLGRQYHYSGHPAITESSLEMSIF